ncbi:DUF6438 domain-containing protein [Mucilaginibacter lacusdianchii]|uniref:DUF6438 domain-containing protein n=1 Tax=Mucilaginibacter lacusdianchii TaxID=2684211 RepID=UPI00131D7AA8|nr:DUF6438 domain-containing protein [Mucilaginibacter sp. JXJ CY 39]
MNLPTLPFTANMLLFAALITLCLCFACYREKHRKHDLIQLRQNEITKIEVATGNCFGPCQRIAISIDSTLAYKSYGGPVSFQTPPDRDRILEGYYVGRISRTLWDALNVNLEKIHYQQLRTSYKHVDDDQSVEVIIHYQGKVKHIKAKFACMPDSVHRVFYSIAESYRQVNLKLVKDTILFETSIQRTLLF